MSDKELMALLRENPSAGFDELFSLYAGYVYAVVKSKLCGIASAEDIEECASDVFALFYRQLDRLDLSKGSIKSYLMVIARRRAMYIYRSLAAKQVSVESIDDEFFANTLCTDEDITAFAEQEEERRALIGAISALGNPDAEIIYRRFYLGQSVKETALRLKMSESAAVKCTRKSLEKLRAVLGGVNMEEKLQKLMENPGVSDREAINQSGADLSEDMDAATRVKIRAAAFCKAGLPAQNKKGRRSVMIRKLSRQKIAALAVFLALVICGSIFALSRLIGQKDGIVCTPDFQALFFGIKDQALEEDVQGSPNYSAVREPLEPGKFGTTLTLWRELRAADDNKYFALKVKYYVTADAADEKPVFKTAYDYFVSIGMEAGIIDDEIFLVATKAQIAELCEKGDTLSPVGADFELANPTAEQQALEELIAYY